MTQDQGTEESRTLASSNRRTDVDAEMGPMGIVPGSHQGPLFDLYDQVGDGDAPRWLTIEGRTMPAAPDWSRGGYTTIFDQ